jgi:hypothetical protein
MYEKWRRKKRQCGESGAEMAAGIENENNVMAKKRKANGES